MAWLLHTCALYQSLLFFYFYQETNLVHLRLWAGLASISNTLSLFIIESFIIIHTVWVLVSSWMMSFCVFPPLQFWSMCVCTYQKMTNFHTTKPPGFPSLLCTASSLRLLDVASLCPWLVSSFLIKALLQFTVLDFLISGILLLFTLNFYNMPTLCI